MGVWGVLVPPMISVTLRKVCRLIAAVVGEVQGEVLRALQNPVLTLRACNT